MFSRNLLIVLIILIAFCAYSVFKIFLDIKRKKECPDEKDLRNTVLGLSARRGADPEGIISHLGICQKCRDKVSEFNSAS